MKSVNNIIAMVLVIFVVAACNKNPDGSMSWQPASLDLTPPPGPPIYQKGFSEGCESGSNAYSSQFYKSIGAFKYKFDPKLRNDRVYYQIWKDAFLYCSLLWEGTNSGNI